ncbi:hypothetical protein ES705_43943 [subsurface metagenome]
MSEDRQKRTEAVKGGRRFAYLRLILVGVVVAAIVCGLMWKAGLLDFRSIDDKFAAIDAELAIPDAENAAVYYKRFFTDPNNEAILYDLSDHTPSAYCEPWLDTEHPELAAKLKTHRTFLQTLLDISEMQEARFPVYYSPGSDSAQFLWGVRKVAMVFSWAAANDLAEGRIDAAYSKYQCQLKLARHLQQQPAAYYKYVGIAIEAVAHGNIKMAVMQDNITQDQLSLLETTLKITQNNRSEDDEIADKVDNLIERKERSQQPLTIRLKAWWRALRTRQQDEKRLYQIHLRLLSSRQSTRILIALRRYKQETGAWPGTLEQIEPRLPEQMLIDPQNNGAFVYNRDGEDFVFYSKGPNNIDEGGSYSGSADDWPIWPLKIK